MKKSGIAGLEVFYEKQNKQVSNLQTWEHEDSYEWISEQ